jgi:RNA polymerase sigma-70 factor (ECF subfamily)
MWPNTDDTQHLIDEARQGDATAVDRLLTRHRESLRRMVGMRLDPALAARVDASDIVQDVLLEAHRRLTDYLRNPAMPFHLWLRHIAKDHIIDAHRRHRQAQRRSLDREQSLFNPGPGDSSVDWAMQFVDPEKTPASAVIRHEMERRVQEAINQLGEDDREIILMRYVEQLSNQDVAAALGLTEAAASMRCLRAVRRLQAALLGEANAEESEG